jgi:arylsulfatase A-like enzyme
VSSQRSAVLAAGLLLLVLSSCERGAPTPDSVALEPLVVPKRLAPVANRKARKPTSIVLISIDTLRADHLGCYGYARPTSPALDRLASESVLFERAYSQANTTAASHMSLFTSVYPEAHGVYNWGEGANQRLSARLPTLALMLQRAGYRTAALTAGGNVRAELGFDIGVSDYRIVVDVEHMLSQAADWIERHVQGDGGATPLFLFLHTYAVHDPYLPPEPWRSRFTSRDYRGRILGSKDELLGATRQPWEQQHRLYWERVDRASRADRRRLIDLYDAGIRHVDQQLERFFERLESLGLDDQMIVVVLSDHGEQFQEHGAYLHQALYQEILHVPLLIRLPSGQHPELRGRRLSQPVRLVDVMPTLLELVGLPRPDHLQGDSIMKLLSDSGSRPRYVLSQWPLAHHHSLQVGRWKLIRRGAVTELYDTLADPGEQHNLARYELEARTRLLESLVLARMRLREYRQVIGQGSEAEIDTETRKQLEALGYLGGG